jgi:chromosome segregation ATPase
MVRCNRCDWTLNCCENCPCSLARIEIKDREINNLKQQVLNLMTRRTDIGAGENLAEENVRLTKENQSLINQLSQFELEKQNLIANNNRLRGERNYYRENRNESRQELTEVNNLAENVSQTIVRLEEKVSKFETENQELKQKVEGLNQQIQNYSTAGLITRKQ